MALFGARKIVISGSYVYCYRTSNGLYIIVINNQCKSQSDVFFLVSAIQMLTWVTLRNLKSQLISAGKMRKRKKKKKNTRSTTQTPVVSRPSCCCASH